MNRKTDETEYLSPIKTTPLKIGKISAKHLTPCRRVGLCRNIKRTPTITTIPSPTISSISPLRKKDIAQETPIILNSGKSITKNKDLKITGLPRVKKNLKLETESPKCKIFNNSVVTSEPKVCDTEANEPKESVPFSNLKIANEMCKTNKHNEVISNTKDLNLEVKSVSKGSLLIKMNTKPGKNTSAKKPFTKILSMNRTSSSSELSELEDPLFTETSTVLPSQGTNNRLSNVESDEENLEINVVGNKSSKRKIIYSSDEDDFVSSQNSFTGNFNSKDLEKKNAEIKQRIQLKMAQLEKLQQSAIYKKLHNVDQLHEITETWKKGCQDALGYLLVKLQCHGPMSMSTLLVNLHIPKELIDYNIDNDSLI